MGGGHGQAETGQGQHWVEGRVAGGQGEGAQNRYGRLLRKEGEDRESGKALAGFMTNNYCFKCILQESKQIVK